MVLQRILEADVITHLFFLGGSIILICMVLFRPKNQLEQLFNPELNSQMIGLYYQLESGLDLFICKTSRDKDRLIANLVEALTKGAAEATGIIERNSFQKVCGEVFKPTRLHIKLISSTTSIYPMYHHTGILVGGSDSTD